MIETQGTEEENASITMLQFMSPFKFLQKDAEHQEEGCFREFSSHKT
jgi:hypothetical protein